MWPVMRKVVDALRGWTAEDDSYRSSPHVGQKAEDDPGFSRPTGAEKRSEEPAEPDDEPPEGTGRS